MIRISPHLRPSLPSTICQGQHKMWFYCACLCTLEKRAIPEMESAHSGRENRENKFIFMTFLAVIKVISDKRFVFNYNSFSKSEELRQKKGLVCMSQTKTHIIKQTYRMIVEHKLYSIQLHQFASAAIVTSC